MVKTQTQFCANFNWILHTFRFPNLLTLTTKPHFVNTQSNQNLTSWSYSIHTKPNQAQPISYKQYNISYPNCKLDIISYLNTSNIFSSVKSQHLPQQKFGGAQRRNSKSTFAVQVYKLSSTYFFALTFEPNINIANFFLRHFYF